MGKVPIAPHLGESASQIVAVREEALATAASGRRIERRTNMTFAHVLPMALSCVLAYTTSSAPGSIFRSPRAPGYELVKGMWVARQFFFRAPLVFRGTPRGIRTFRGIHYFKRLAIKWLGELTTDQMTAVDKWPLSSSTSSMADFFCKANV